MLCQEINENLDAHYDELQSCPVKFISCIYSVALAVGSLQLGYFFAVVDAKKIGQSVLLLNHMSNSRKKNCRDLW